MSIMNEHYFISKILIFTSIRENKHFSRTMQFDISKKMLMLKIKILKNF